MKRVLPGFGLSLGLTLVYLSLLVLLPLSGLVMQSDGLEGKAQGRREQAGSEEQARQTVGQEKEAIGLRRYGCARSAPPRR